MKKIIRIDETGLFIEDVLIKEDELIPTDCIEIYCPNGFYLPKWNGTEWVEGLTQDEIDALNNQPRELTEIELLQEENSKLKTRLYETEIATAETSSMQEELIMLLIEMGVI